MKKLIVLLLVVLTISCSKNKKENIYNKFAVSTTNPLATKIGIDILKNGGNAFDAAVAIHYALSVVYPQAGNIGGGGFMIARLKDGNTLALDFREIAPIKSNPRMYLDQNDNVIDKLSQEGALAVGVPGSVAGMDWIFKNYCTMDFDDLIDPSIKLAEDGFKITKHIANELNEYNSLFKKINYNYTNVPFYKEGEWKEKDELIQEDLANTLKRIRDKGKDDFYNGLTAELIVKTMEKNKGIITLEDLKQYEVRVVEPIKTDWNGFKIISMSPPSSGGIALVQLLNGYQKLYNDFGKPTKNSANDISLMTEIERRVYAVRNEYLGDAEFTYVPVKKLIDKNYLDKLFSGINPNIIGNSDDLNVKQYLDESEQTTHFSIVDGEGNAVAITTTLNNTFGSGLMVEDAGFLLNNEMDDFSIKPGFPNIYDVIGSIPNSIAPRKKMLSSMTPTILEKNNKLYMVVGSPGGSTIITTVFQVIINVIFHNMNIQQAVDTKRVHFQWKPNNIFLEENSITKEVEDELINKGYQLKYRKKIGQVNAISLSENGDIVGGADITRGDNTADGD